MNTMRCAMGVVRYAAACTSSARHWVLGLYGSFKGFLVVVRAFERSSTGYSRCFVKAPSGNCNVYGSYWGTIAL